VRSFLEHIGGAEALAESLAGASLPADIAKIGVRVAAGSGGKQPALVEAFTTAGKLTTRSSPPSGAERDKLLSEIMSLGDPARGEAVFRRKDMACLKCHAIAGAGGQVGPSLESIGASAPLDYLLDSLFEPDKAVKENYHSSVVATKDGRLLSGIKIRQNDNEITVRDADDREVTIPRSDVEEEKTGGSLMPAGQIDPLTRAELLDLVRFLSQLGKIGPYSVSNAMVARRWQVLEPTPESAEAIRRGGLEAAVRGDSALSWVPAYSRVSGVLPVDAIPTVSSTGDSRRIGMARCLVEVSAPGEIKLVGDAPSTLDLWIDGKPISFQHEIVLKLDSGVHTLTFALTLERIGAGFRCELADVAGSPAKAQFVVGK
jgi:putative heme-binding domain-containing protein